MMVWNEDESEFEKLNVSSVAFISTNLYEITLSSAPGFTIAAGDVISPYTDRHEVMAEQLQSYFDLIGPGEVVNLATDVRATRAYRYPTTSEEYPQRAGAAVVTAVLDGLGGAAGDGDVASISQSTPAVPASVTDGPNMLTLGKVGVYDLE